MYKVPAVTTASVHHYSAYRYFFICYNSDAELPHSGCLFSPVFCKLRRSRAFFSYSWAMLRIQIRLDLASFGRPLRDRARIQGTKINTGIRRAKVRHKHKKCRYLCLLVHNILNLIFNFVYSLNIERLSLNSYWVLRLPYVYWGEGGAHLPPLVPPILDSPAGFLLKGTFKIRCSYFVSTGVRVVPTFHL
jgi:hypothetical protein